MFFMKKGRCLVINEGVNCVDEIKKVQIYGWD